PFRLISSQFVSLCPIAFHRPEMGGMEWNAILNKERQAGAFWFSQAWSIALRPCRRRMHVKTRKPGFLGKPGFLRSLGYRPGTRQVWDLFRPRVLLFSLRPISPRSLSSPADVFGRFAHAQAVAQMLKRCDKALVRAVQVLAFGNQFHAVVAAHAALFQKLLERH